MQSLAWNFLCHIGIILFISNTLFAQANFSDEIIIIRPLTNAATSVHAADLDGDGDMDVLSASAGDSKIAWYENMAGQGTFGIQKVITTSAAGANSVVAADLDGDGDTDVLSASANDNKIAWYENMDGHGVFGPQQIITTSAVGARSVFAADLDGDGDIDALSASADLSPSHQDNKIAWYENTDGHGSFGIQQIITTSVHWATSVHAADLDGDGDLDVLSASYDDSKIAWYENTDGKGTFGVQQIITSSADAAFCVLAADLDGDEDIDVLTGGAWYENTDGQGSFGAERLIETPAGLVTSTFSADLDLDGDLDILITEESGNKVAWYENQDGLGRFSTQKVITTSAGAAESVYAADLDSDGDIDVLSASLFDDKIAWYENLDGHGGYGTQIVITTSVSGAQTVYAADIDNDGDIDALSASWYDNKIAWYENTDGQGSFGLQRVITTSLNGAYSVYAADLDSDGDMDVLSASRNDDRIAWYENLDGQGSFGMQTDITRKANGAYSVFAADLDRDGDFDVLSASAYDDKIAWYENTNGLGSFSTQKVITTSANGAYSVYATDLDGDGDMDVLSASHDDDKIAWYKNTDGQGTFGAQIAITTLADGARYVFAADLDSDGDMDALSASRNDDKIAWYENTDGHGSFGPQQVISVSADGATSVFATDLNGDQDIDVLSGSFNDDKIAWFENTDGQGSFGPQQLISASALGVYSVFAADLDGDEDMDVLSATWWNDTIAWYRNLTHPTDVTEIKIGQPVFKLRTNYPNPFNSSTVISYLIAVTSDVELAIYNQFGQVVKILVNQRTLPGIHQTVWDGRNNAGRRLASGIYLYRIRAGSFVQARKMVLIY